MGGRMQSSKDAETQKDCWQPAGVFSTANQALLRAALIALRAQGAAHLSWPVLFEQTAHKPPFSFQLVTQRPAK